MTQIDVDPRGSYWLGRLAPLVEIMNSTLGERAERLEPCALGLRVLPARERVTFTAIASFVVWRRVGQQWQKPPRIHVEVPVELPDKEGSAEWGRAALSDAIDAVAPGSGLAATIRTELSRTPDGKRELSIELVNDSDPDHKNAGAHAKGRLFECSLQVRNLATHEYLLEELPDSFRYDRRVAAWGLNSGVERVGDGFVTTDLPEFEKKRPVYWTVPAEQPDLSFQTLSSDPIPQLERLHAELDTWGKEAWAIETIRRSAPSWSETLENEVQAEARSFRAECDRIAAGIDLLKGNALLARAFQAMNAAMSHSANGKYDSWRPFQIGFMLANLPSCVGDDQDVADIVWFSTGGGKTETYLGIILTAAFYDRLTGKSTGITAWSRFPLRLLSLQQTQRFANALAGAERVRQALNLEGDPFSLGFLVGGGATPNEVKEKSPWDPDDPTMPDKLRMLKVCPFCRNGDIEMRFDWALWRVDHICRSPSCPWGSDQPLPIHVVDTEVWRVLPTVVVGTLDKAAGISMQASMRGMIAEPSGFCPRPGHGHTYATRANRPHGCLVPGCTSPRGPLPMAKNRYGVGFRLQDELHLLRDSLGAVDAHYEALYDDLQQRLSGRRPKILASSATLSGYERQSDVLYGRTARVFPHPEPKVGEGFWSGKGEQSMRRYLAVAPRGQTIEYALDRMIVSLQRAIRELAADPEKSAADIGVDPKHIDWLISFYGTDVVYGNTLRDLDAVVRSGETQWEDVPPPRPRVASLTGRTVFTDVSGMLDELEQPAADFADRTHVVVGSSMMSHGVDIDRLNVMVMLGLPLTTAEFIQATARVGRTWPSLVFVVHKIGRERDASVYRTFRQFVDQGDRFVEPIPITNSSRRVLERTLAGLAFGRVLMMHEPEAGTSLALTRKLRDYLASRPDFEEAEVDAICAALRFDDDRTPLLRQEVKNWYRHLMTEVLDPANAGRFGNELGLHGGPMMSLRDVEEQVEVWGRDPS
ncbi:MULTISPECIES: helicase-related protein [Sphingomonas]|uniref:helicase-related protein n=1 Tax=Sphingomonas TaxID=13687 RepID=UPI0018E44C16|nr:MULTISPECIES: helicase-related protein [Sphingomonas]